MKSFIFRFFTKKTLILIISIYLIVQITNQAYCSSYCSYQNVGSTYLPMCTDHTSAGCTKCDQNIFSLVGTTCQPHGYFNQSLQTTDLTSPLGSWLTSWHNTTNLFRSNIVGGLYDLMQFYVDSITPAGGDDKVYKIFTNLPPHYTVRARFFILRSAPSTMAFYYYIDNHKFQYDYSKYPSSATLGDIVTTQKIFHQDPNLTIAFQVNFSGLDQSIGVKQLLIFITKCPQYCQFCDSSQNCVKCTYGTVTPAYLHEGHCYLQCPQNLYGSTNITNKCEYCQSQCQNCLVNSSHCIQCKSEGRYQSFLLNNTCYYDCPSGFFENFDNNTCICPIDGFFINSNYTCQNCAPQCNSCFGSLRTQCYNCSVGSFLIHGTSQCSSSCPSGQYGDQLARVCNMCSSLCSECQNSPGQCKACYFRVAIKYLYNSQCVIQCPRGYGKNFNIRKCQICPPYYYSYNGQCVVQCPQMYVPNNQSKSCLHMNETNFSIMPKVIDISVLPDGKSLVMQISFSEGLSDSSKNWIYTQGYYNASLKNQELSSAPSSVSIQNDYTVKITFPVDGQITQNNHFYIDFGTRLNTTTGLSYSKTSYNFKVTNYPNFLFEYFKTGSKSYFKILMIPVFLVLATLIGLKLRGTYDLFIQTVRLFQFVGLTVFLIYPMQSQINSFLQGFNYFNFEFFPNIYNWFVPKFSNSLENQLFSGFQFIYGDMDFIRMIGSILVFIAVWIIVIIVLKCFVIKNPILLGWFLRIGMDLVEVKVIHSFWNSLIFTFMNSAKQNIYILWVHLFSYVFMGLVTFRYYKIYQNNGTLNYPFIWRVLSTLFISIAVFNKMIVLIFLNIISIGFGIKHFNQTKQQNKQLQNFKFGSVFFMRDTTLSILPLLQVMAVCMITFYKNQMLGIAVIVTISSFSYVLIILEVIIYLLMKYFYNRRVKAENVFEKNTNASNAEERYNYVEQNSTINDSFNTQNFSYIKDEFAADFQNAHKRSIDLHQDEQQDINDSKIRTTLERTNQNSAVTKMQQMQQKSSLHATKYSQMKQRKSRKNNPPQLKKNQQNFDSQEDPIQMKFKRANRTEALKRKQQKVQPMRTLSTQKDEQPEFEHIVLKKEQKQMSKDKGKVVNLSELIKKANTVSLQRQHRSSPRLHAKIHRTQQNKDQKVQSKQKPQIKNEKSNQNIFMNQEEN